MSRFTNFSKFAFATLIGIGSLGVFSQSEGVKADSLDRTSQNTVQFIPSSTITNTFEQRTTIVPESKVIQNHYVKYSKTHYQVKESIPKEIYYSSEGFKGYVQVTTIIDIGDHFLTFYSGTVIRC
ncbi:hypothetical protein [Bacillus gaemokensis]|uniref:Uncharacterized protein n=1 Tax=Bacillus gaemokensis TaxID=574375 RepID=A0A073KAK4_9BACI|nr:hypothetical protein [Bacillus gaemokensis]KEK23457.1 hypothetical protein BAGA_08100 [Bacillus gaemokensis]KYG27175.1 hypothetical protein AZF08_15595 [Bacillus gaemokensis]